MNGSNTTSWFAKDQAVICKLKKFCVHLHPPNSPQSLTQRSSNSTEGSTVPKRKFKVWRGDAKGGEFKEFEQEVGPGMVVLDVLHGIQAEQAGDLAIRWNCKAGKCGSCSMEINGRPRLSCMARMN